ncbi:MAG: hypothetical protein ABSF90_08980 [Syntrophobacteraceae bacterium]|jgi:hypothetical protein
MPFKDPEKRRSYHRQYMRDSRAALNPPGEAAEFDATQPYEAGWLFFDSRVYGRRHYPVLLQEGRVYDRGTHRLLREV